jgi:predicted phage terminase large subunit-like protein
MDSLLENLMPNRQLASIRRIRELIQEPLKEWTKVRLAWKSARYRAHTDDYSQLLWPEKLDADELKSKRASYISQGIPEVYAQEYLNVPLDDSYSYFRRQDFLAMSPDQKHLERLKWYITFDFAISEDTRADYTVALVAAVDDSGLLHIRNVIRDRLDGGEIVDLILRLNQLYKPEWIGVEEGQIKKSIWSFLQEQMRRMDIYPSFLMLKPITDKESRAKAIQGRMRAQGVRFDKEGDWYQDFEDELVRFPRDKHDDQVDAFAWLGQMLDRLIHAPTAKEQADEDLEEERQRTGLTLIGRNSVTGY